MVMMDLNRSPRTPIPLMGQGRRTRQRVAPRLVATLLLLAGGTVSFACSTDKSQPPSDQAKFELKQDSQGRIVRLNRITGEMAVIQGNQVIPASESSKAKARSATRTARSPKPEPTPADQPIAAAEPVTRARPGETVTTSTEAPIYVTPGYPTPLRVVGAGSVLRVVAIQDDWYQVEFKDPQWGKRVGFVSMASTRASSTPSSPSEPMDLSVRELKPRELEPMDLSIRSPK
jgi:hypothetical protein